MSSDFTATPHGDTDIVITRSFAAAPELVFDALTRPELLKRWMKGPDGWEMTVCDIDLSNGGAFRQAWSGPSGGAMEITGTYRAVERPSRIVRTEQMMGTRPEDAALSTARIEADGDRTLLTNVLTFPSREARDRAIASNMAAGVAAGYMWLDALLADLNEERQS